MTLVDADAVKFPDVLICNANPDNETAMTELGLDKNLELRFFIETFSKDWDFNNFYRQVQNAHIGANYCKNLKMRQFVFYFILSIFCFSFRLYCLIKVFGP